MENRKLLGKKVLFICPHFFDYEKLLKDEMERLGAIVYYFDERLSNNLSDKILLRINREILGRKIEYYYMKEIFLEIADINFDFLLVCRAESIPESFLKKFSRQQKNCKKILYLWDSIADNSNGFKKRKYFDEVVTFDHLDSKKYALRLRPLFFSKDYETIYREKDFKYEAMFVGTAHDDRYSILEDLKQKIGSDRVFFYYYLQSPIMLLYYKFLKKSYPLSARKEYFGFTPMNSKEIAKIMRSSKVIVDIQKKNQSGLTMRTIEVLGAGRKLITTNKEIAEYDFYDERNIAIIERESPVLSNDFLNIEYKDIDEDIVSKYSITNFVIDIFGITKKNNTFTIDKKYE